MSCDAINARREEWYRHVRRHIPEYFNPDGSGAMPQFNPPWREPVWILPALYTGSAGEIALANRIVERYNDDQPCYRVDEKRTLAGKDFNIFQSTIFAKNLKQFGHLLTSGARQVMQWHTEQVFKTCLGAQQSDYKFHGANDNMPMMATMGNILGGEALGSQDAIAHGRWMLHQFRRLLSRSAWASEYNSVTYSAVTLSCVAKIATYSGAQDIRNLAMQIEHRLWAEIILHFHPATLQQAGPHARAYAVDTAGHTHSLHMLYWLMFGSEISGRDMIRNCFSPDPKEVMHFCGCPAQNIAEYSDFIDADFHLPDELARLMTQRRYPSTTRGRTEAMGVYGAAGDIHTTTYMTEDYSLGTADVLSFPEQGTALYATYRRRAKVEKFRDSGTLFIKYISGPFSCGQKEPSADGKFTSERHIPNFGWMHTQQKDHTALLLASPHIQALADKPTSSLKLCLIFPAHFGGIRQTIMGRGHKEKGAQGSNLQPVAVSVEAGEVVIHIRPLLPTLLPRTAAIRWNNTDGYEVLELINYDGSERCFSRSELSRVLNGCVITIRSRKDTPNLEDFHRVMSDCLITDYFSAGHRYFLYQRNDIEFETVMTTDPFGVQTATINGRPAEKPVLASDSVDASTLPFMAGNVARNAPHFPWADAMPQTPWPNTWLIGSRGLPGEDPYSRPAEGREPK